MRKMWIILLGLILLSGCTLGAADSSASAPVEAPSDAAGWGVMDLDDAAFVPQAEASTVDSALESAPDSSLETPPSSTQPESLRDVLSGTATVWVDGQELTGVFAQGVTLVSVTELSEIWPWFRGSGDGKTWSYTGQADFPHEIECQSPEKFDGTGGICFQRIQEEYWLPARWISDELGADLLWDSETSTAYLTAPVRKRDIPQGVQVPTLMYHAVSDDLWGISELFVSPSEMEKQLSYLKENGYETIFFSDLPNLADYEKPVLLTFDDGYDDNYTELLPLLQKYNVKATVFMIADAMGMQHKMTEEQVREMADSGLVSIQSHGLTHADMDAMDEETLIRELGESQRILTRVTGRQPSVLCYPTGRYSDLTLEVAERYYNFGLKMVGGQYNTADDPFLVSRYYVSRYTGLDSFAAMVAPAGT